MGATTSHDLSHGPYGLHLHDDLSTVRPRRMTIATGASDKLPRGDARKSRKHDEVRRERKGSMPALGQRSDESPMPTIMTTPAEDMVPTPYDIRKLVEHHISHDPTAADTIPTPHVDHLYVSDLERELLVNDAARTAAAEDGDMMARLDQIGESVKRVERRLSLGQLTAPLTRSLLVKQRSATNTDPAPVDSGHPTETSPKLFKMFKKRRSPTASQQTLDSDTSESPHGSMYSKHRSATVVPSSSHQKHLMAHIAQQQQKKRPPLTSQLSSSSDDSGIDTSHHRNPTPRLSIDDGEKDGDQGKGDEVKHETSGESNEDNDSENGVQNRKKGKSRRKMLASKLQRARSRSLGFLFGEKPTAPLFGTSYLNREWEIVTVKEMCRRLSLDEIDHIEMPIPEGAETSQILDELMIRQVMEILPARAEGYPWVNIYNSEKHGFSLATLYRKMAEFDEDMSPVLLIIRDTNEHVFGAIVSSAIRPQEGYSGTGDSCLLWRFTGEVPHTRELRHYTWTGDNQFFVNATKENLSIGAGGGHLGLWVDADLNHGRSQRCETFDNEPLTGDKEDFIIQFCEAYGFRM